MSAHIVILNIPAAGHVLPTLDLVEELIARGHRVDYLTTAEYADLVMGVGAHAALYESSLVSRPTAPATPGDFADWLPFVLLNESAQILPRLLELFASDQPDLLIYDRAAYTTGRALAELWNIPAIEWFSSFAYNEDFNLASATNQRTMLDPANPVYRQFEVNLAQFADQYGTTVLGIDEFVTARATEAIVAVPREFQIAGETFGPNYHFAGPGLQYRLKRSRAKPTVGGSHLYVSLGTAFNDRPDLFALIARSFAATNWTVTMAVGELDQGRLGSIPANVTVHRRVDQLAVLETADVFVTHAGMGSMMEAVYFGVPIVALPQSAEQGIIAHRAEELGLGLVASPEATADMLSLVDHVDKNETIADAVRQMRDVTRAYRGADYCCDVIERRLTITRRLNLTGR